MSDLAAQISEIVNLAVNDRVEEALDRIGHQYDILQADDRGWQVLFGADTRKSEGLTLEQLKQGSSILREAVAGSPLPKQANSLRYSYTFSQPFIIPGLLGSVEATETRPGRRTKTEIMAKALKDFSENDTAKQYFFGREAQELISTACSTDGHYFLLCDSTNKDVQPIPLSEINGTYLDPEFPGKVWGYLRVWTSYDTSGKAVENKKWYLTDRFPVAQNRPRTLGEDPEKVPVDPTKTMIDLRVGSQVGWTFGIPDLSAGEVWNRNYINALKDGLEVSKTLAFYSAKVRTKSPSAGATNGLKVSDATGAGKTVFSGNDVDVFSSAGKVYDYDGARPIAAMYALSAGVSVVDLLASPSAAGASYGSAAALAPGLRRAIEARRSQIAAWMERVLKWATGENIQVTPASIEEVEPYRRTQITALAWNSGLFHADEIRPEFAYLAGITLKHDNAPDGVLAPNNRDSLPRKDIDTDSAGQNPTTASPGQGQSSGDGGAGSTAANDLRSDTVS